jgi:hypothetical protein
MVLHIVDGVDHKSIVKQGDNVLKASFNDQPNDDCEFRDEFDLSRVEFGPNLEHSVESGADENSEELTVPNPMWGQPGFSQMGNFFAGIFGGAEGKKKFAAEVPKTMKTKRFKTDVKFIVRKLEGTMGIKFEQSDYKKLKGKKHVKKPKRKRRDPYGFGGGGKIVICTYYYIINIKIIT